MGYFYGKQQKVNDRKERCMNPTITRLKALGILLMIIGHSECSIPQFVPFIYMFHMPLFFIASGMCLKQSSLDDPKKFFVKRFKGLYWPFVKWGIAFLLLHNVFASLHLYDDTYTLSTMASRAMYIVLHMADVDNLLGGYWFLSALLTGYVVAWLMLRCFRRFGVNGQVAIVGGATLIISVLMNCFSDVLTLESTVAKYIPLSFVFFSTRSFEVALYIVVGYWLSNSGFKPFNNWLIIASLVLAFVGSYYWRINTGEMFFENSKYLPYLVTSIFAVWGIYSLLHKFEGYESRFVKTVDFVGNNTLTFLTWHMLVFRVVSALIMWIYALPNIVLSEHPIIHEYSAKGWWLVYFVVAVLVCYGISCINKRITNSWLKL